MRDRRLTGIAAAAIIVGVAACGGSGSSGGQLASQTPDQIVTRATRAIDRVSSVRVSGSVGDGSPANAIALKLNLVSGRGATGSMSEHGLSFKLVTVGGEAYVNGSAEFWKQFGGPAVARRLHGRWLRAPTASGEFSSFASLTDVHKLLAHLLSGHGALAKGTTSTVDGRKVIAIHDTSKQGTLYVAATGTPYPIRISNGSSSGGHIDFSRFNRPVSLKTPASSIDISAIKH
jgi:hypothetical protein